MANDKIIIKGAREHNLKNINLTLPREKLIVMTGLSGSGKSSLAFDTIYADGQRRYVESLSSYARMFLGRMDKPDVDEITGLSPAISIDQKTTSHNPRSLLCRSGTVHGNVKVAAQQPQRQEEICRQQHDGQRGRQAQLTLGKGGHRTDDAQPGPAVGHQVHQGHRIQLHGQHLHGDLAEALGLGVHLLMLPAIGLIDLQGGQALDVFQKAVAHLQV